MRKSQDLVLLSLERLLDFLLRDGGADGRLHLIDLRAVGLEADGDSGNRVRCSREMGISLRTTQQSCLQSTRCAVRARSRRARRGWQQPRYRQHNLPPIHKPTKHT